MSKPAVIDDSLFTANPAPVTNVPQRGIEQRVPVVSTQAVGPKKRVDVNFKLEPEEAERFWTLAARIAPPGRRPSAVALLRRAMAALENEMSR